jgi:hypothetical protein
MMQREWQTLGHALPVNTNDCARKSFTTFLPKPRPAGEGAAQVTAQGGALSLHFKANGPGESLNRRWTRASRALSPRLPQRRAEVRPHRVPPPTSPPAACLHVEVVVVSVRAHELQHYAMEHFLYRLSTTSHRARFVLKGALMLHVWETPLARAT